MVQLCIFNIVQVTKYCLLLFYFNKNEEKIAHTLLCGEERWKEAEQSEVILSCADWDRGRKQL